MRTDLLCLALITSALTAFPAFAQQGFAISVGGETRSGDRELAQSVRRQMPAFQSSARVLVTVDGLEVRPRLDLEVLHVDAGTVTLRSRSNYPLWITRGEVRVLRRDPAGATVVLAAVPIGPNDEVRLSQPEGEVVAVLRVYDVSGRWDETVPVALNRAMPHQGETGNDRTARRGIPVAGGAVTVSGSGLAPGAVVSAIGETVRPDAEGAFVLQRILPAGSAAVPVRVTGGGEDLLMTPVVNIPRSDWFTVASADLTFGRELSGVDEGKRWNRGRLAYYTKGRTASGWVISSSADTGAEPLRDLFRDFDRKDPLGLIARLDPEQTYPTYGDDAEIENGAPTDGKFYFRAERDGSYVMWGNAKAPVRGTQYLRNERSLYGLSAHYGSSAETARGEPRLSLGAYAAQPDQLPGRDIFLGTGGSIYFLRRQDIATGTETVSSERRDPDTGRVLERRLLVEGRDYQINYLQGVVTLSAPLSAGSGSGGPGSGVVVPDPGSAPESRLVVQYEFTPAAGDVTGMAYGGRAEGWISDSLRIGVTGLVEQTDVADQTATGVDLRYLIGEDSWIEAEVARSRGPGFGSTYSADGGLTIGTTASAGGRGDAARAEAHLTFGDLRLDGEGHVDLWAERRTAGFSTLDLEVTDDDETYGLEVEGASGEKLSWRVRAEHYAQASGNRKDEALFEAALKVSDRLTLSAGLQHENRRDPASAKDNGRRTDLAVKASVTANERLNWYVFGQTTIEARGGLGRNDRLGVGGTWAFAEGWGLTGEVSGGSAGAGGKALLSYEAGGSAGWLGYELDPGRELDGIALDGRDGGRLTAGGRRPVTDSLTVFAENSYDLFGRHRALTSAYGVDYELSQALSLSAGLDIGRVRDPAGDFDRRGLSLGVSYDDDAGITAQARLEVIRDRGQRGGGAADADTVVVKAAGTVRIDAAQRLLFTFDAARTRSTGTVVPDGDYAKLTLGYAFRPVEDDALNILARYTYLHDMYGQRVDGLDDPGPRQQSHVLSIDMTQDVGPNWTLGAKIGLRAARTAPDALSPLVRNNAALVVVNARYHMTHEWDALIEARKFKGFDSGLSETGFLASVNRQIGPNLVVGIGYDFGTVSDDLTDLATHHSGVFLNIVSHF